MEGYFVFCQLLNFLSTLPPVGGARKLKRMMRNRRYNKRVVREVERETVD